MLRLPQHSDTPHLLLAVVGQLYEAVGHGGDVAGVACAQRLALLCAARVAGARRGHDLHRSGQVHGSGGAAAAETAACCRQHASL